MFVLSPLVCHSSFVIQDASLRFEFRLFRCGRRLLTADWRLSSVLGEDRLIIDRSTNKCKQTNRQHDERRTERRTERQRHLTHDGRGWVVGGMCCTEQALRDYVVLWCVVLWCGVVRSVSCVSLRRHAMLSACVAVGSCRALASPGVSDECSYVSLTTICSLNSWAR